MPIDTYLSRAGGSLAKFVGTSLREIEKGQFTRRTEFAALFFRFLKKLRELGADPAEARQHIEAFLLFSDRPQVVAGGDLEVGGAIRNVRETEMGLDLKIDFEAPAAPVLGGSAIGAGAGFSYRTSDKEETTQNFRARLRWEYVAGPVALDQQQLAAIAEKVLTDTAIPIPELQPEDLGDPMRVVEKALPLLTTIASRVGGGGGEE